MTLKLLSIMDAPQAIHYKKDTTLGLLLAASKKNWQIYYAQPQDLFISKEVHTICQKIQVHNQDLWYTPESSKPMALKEFDAVLMRKDPPFDSAYLYATYLLELAQNEGCLIINNPKSIRDANEKLYALWFKNCFPPNLVSSRSDLIHQFLQDHGKIVIKPLDSMGGENVFLLEKGSLNTNVIIEMLTQKGRLPIMAQRFIPEIKDGDKRIILIDGVPFPYGLRRVPKEGDFRGNLVKGAKGVGFELSERDKWLCAQVGPTLKQKGLVLVGIDVIGDYLTEVNVTSPTCVREIEAAYQVDLSGKIWDCIESKVKI